MAIIVAIVTIISTPDETGPAKSTLAENIPRKTTIGQQRQRQQQQHTATIPIQAGFSPV